MLPPDSLSARASKQGAQVVDIGFGDCVQRRVHHRGLADIGPVQELGPWPSPAALDESLGKLATAAAEATSAAALGAAASSLRTRLGSESPEARDRELLALDAALTGDLPAELARLSAGLHAGKFDRAALPQTIADRWIASGGRELVEITPRENVSDNGTASRFIAAGS